MQILFDSPRWLLILAGFVCLVYTNVETLAETETVNSTEIHLTDGWKFKAGDNPAWADPNFNDSDWEDATIPGKNRHPGFGEMSAIGWYRLIVRLPENSGIRQWGISIGDEISADKVYINGAPIGATGKVPNPYMMWVPEPNIYRVYPIPDKFTSAQSEIMLAIRINSIGKVPKDMLVKLGDYEVLLKLGKQVEARKDRFHAIEFSLYAGAFIIALLFYFGAGRKREYLWFCLFAMAIMAMALSTIVFFSDTFFHSAPWVFFSVVAFYLIPFLALYSLEPITGRISPWLVRILISAMLSGVLLGSLIDYQTYPVLFFMLTNSVNFIWVFTFFIVAFYVSLAVRKQVDGALPIFIGLVYAAASYLLDVFGNIRPFQHYGFIELAGMVGMFCFVAGFTRRYHILMQGHKLLSARVLNVVEDERKRLSRELHDNIGQQLLAVRMGLQSFNANKPDPAIEGSIDMLAGSIEDLRGVVQELRPAMLSKLGLEEAIRWHAGRMNEGLNFSIDVQGGLEKRLPEAVEEQLFRIYQESVSNTIKHAEASRIEIRLSKSGDKAMLGIHDDGQGFDVQTASGKNAGIGLLTMKERAEFIGGRYSIESTRGGGTTVTVEVMFQ